MKLSSNKTNKREAFTLIEVTVTAAIIGVVFASFYSGIAAGFSIIGLSRENLRANQILIDKMETLRLYSWEQINSNGFVPPTFTAPFYPPVVGQTNASGLMFHGTVTIANAPFEAGYSTNLKHITVSLVWTNGNHARTRTMDTLVSEFGMQTYVY
jgi:prepilin-type N-terminal cleavage/methylation domain-containing protein